jgi:NADH-quinone oxidoreductase subunit N
MNIYVYVFVLYLFFSLLFLFDIKKIKTINSLKIFNRHNFISITVVLIFLSMSGIPPLAGFIGKFLIFNFLFLSQKYLYIIIFSLLNFFSIYFYIQNLRFLISKTQYNFFLINGYYIFFNKQLLNILVFLNFLNFFGILYLEDIFYLFSNIITYKNIF